MNTPLVSIVIPTFNRAAFLPATIASVLEQDYPAKEIVVVDDGSSDATAEVCARLPVRYLRQENRGGCAARNAGAAHGAGELLVFLDDDDLLAAGSLAHRVNHWLRDTGCDFILGKVRRFTEATPGRLDFIDDESAIQILCLGAGMITRRGFEATGGFDESIKMGDSEEIDLWLRMREAGQRQRFIDELCLLFRRHPGNATRHERENLRDFINRGFMKTLLHASRRKQRAQMHPPAVSVVMPVYNGGDFLRASIESVLAQKGVRVELIIVDGASTDGSADIAKSFGDRVRYFLNTRDTLAIAKNFGIARASHPLIAFMASDDLWPEDKLEKQARWLMANPGAAVCGCHMRHFLHKGCATWPSNFVVNPPEAELVALIPETLLCRREVFDRVGGYDETFMKSADDVDWINRARHAGEKIGILPEVLLRKGVHGGNVTYSRPGVQGDLLRALHGGIRRKRGAG